MSSASEAERILGRGEEAAASLRQALVLQPDYPEACYNLGAVLATLRRRDDAVAVCTARRCG
jgi:Flp pilus assembly protein TadD